MSVDEWFSKLHKTDKEVVNTAQKVVYWFQLQGATIDSNKNKRSITMFVKANSGTRAGPFLMYYPYDHYPTAFVEFSPSKLNKWFDEVSQRHFLDSFNALPGKTIKAGDELTDCPSCELWELGQSKLWGAFQKFADDLMTRIRAAD